MGTQEAPGSGGRPRSAQESPVATRSAGAPRKPQRHPCPQGALGAPKSPKEPPRERPGTLRRTLDPGAPKGPSSRNSVDRKSVSLRLVRFIISVFWALVF